MQSVCFSLSSGDVMQAYKYTVNVWFQTMACNPISGMTLFCSDCLRLSSWKHKDFVISHWCQNVTGFKDVFPVCG